MASSRTRFVILTRADGEGPHRRANRDTNLSDVWPEERSLASARDDSGKRVDATEFSSHTLRLMPAFLPA